MHTGFSAVIAQTLVVSGQATVRSHMMEKNIKYRTSPLITGQNTTKHDKSLKSLTLEPLNGKAESPQIILTKPEQILQRIHRRAVEKNGGSPQKSEIWCQNGVKLRQNH